MPTFIKPGFWEKKQKGYDHWLNLDQLIQSFIPNNPSGLEGTQYSYVAANGTEIENAEEFEAAYAKASLSASPLQPFTIVVGPGFLYFLDIFEFTADYVNVVSLTGLADVVFYNGIRIKADNITLRGLDGGQITPVEVDRDLHSLTCDTMVGVGSSFSTLSRLCGHYINCIGGDSSFGAVNIYGKFENCTGGQYSFWATNYKNIPDNYYASFNNCKVTVGDFNYVETIRLYSCIDGSGRLVNYPLEYELIANKSTDVEADKLSNIKYPSVKAVYDRWGLVENIRFTTAGYLDNFFAGRNAGINNTQLSPTQGTYNTFVGSSAGFKNTTGYAKTNLGYNAGYNETTANGTVNIGYQAGMSNIVGNYNTNLGTDAGSRNKGSNNTFIGWHSGFGFSSFSTGGNNNMFGQSTALNLTSGEKNNGFGSRVFENLTSGSNNTGLGDICGYSLTSGSENVFVGKNSGFSLTAATSNVFVGNSSGFNLTSGNSNTLIGNLAGRDLINASSNILIGALNGTGILQKTDVTDSIAIGYQVFTDKNGQIKIGNPLTATETILCGNILIGTTVNIPSARLQVSSTTQGFLPPRMTNAQRIAIASPAVGLCVYCTDATEGLYVNKSTGWVLLL